MSPAQPKPPIIEPSIAISSRPGIQRDGTQFDNAFYRDGQWVRFQRGRPRKIGGISYISDMLSAPIRGMALKSGFPNNTLHAFSQYGVQQLTFDSDGVGGGIIDRTPVGFVPDPNYTWQSDQMFGGAGGPYTGLFCSATPDLNGIGSDLAGNIYTGDVTAAAALTPVADGVGPITVSGGLVVLHPFLFVYGSNGLIRNSNANNVVGAGGWTGTNANSANVAGTKIVKGLPIRGGGQSPAGMFWALDALIRVSYIGGTSLWSYDTVSSSISVLSKSAIVEYDGVYYWPGLDRFYQYSGVVQELPNSMNSNWFYENLNYAHAQKVWALKIPRFGEIWWFYPRGTATECDSVVIYNVREKTWYDTLCTRSAGTSSQVFRRPIMAGGQPTTTTLVAYTPVAGVFSEGDVITGGTSGAIGTVYRVISGTLNLISVAGLFVLGETISAGAITGTLTSAPSSQNLDVVWQHEIGVNRIYRASEEAIESFYETSSFQWMTGGMSEAPAGSSVQTRILRLEPDFVMTGTMQLEVTGRSYAQADSVVSEAFEFTPETKFISLREQRRELSVKFTSNVLDGDYQMGRVIGRLEQGDTRG